MTWIIIGDSWSSTEINQLSTREFYPFEHSLFQHMRSRYGRDVHCFAEPGHSDLAQLRRLEAGLQGWSEPVRVLWGWTDWARGIGFDNVRNRFNASPHYDADVDRNRWIMEKSLRGHFTYSRAFNNAKFYHWGGQSPVWLDVSTLPGDHTLLTRDFAHDYYNAPPNSGVSTYIGDPDRHHPAHDVRELWPSTPPTRAETLNRLAVKHERWRMRNPKLYPDSGHLRWSLYKKLMDLLPA